jgi:hypothetical protein
MLNTIDHQPLETLYVIVALIDFFQSVAENDRLSCIIHFQDITNSITEYNPLVEESLPGGQKIPKKSLPQPRRFAENNNNFNLNNNNNNNNENNKQKQLQRRVFEIDTKAPIILRDNESTIRRLNKDKIYIDSIHHNNNLIIAAQYASELNRLITIDSYSDQFSIYSPECLLERKLGSKASTIKGQVCIDFCWSEKQ